MQQKPWWLSWLECHSFVLVILKVEGSNPGVAVSFSSRNTQLKAGTVGLEWECACAIVLEMSIAHARNLDFRYTERKFDFLGMRMSLYMHEPDKQSTFREYSVDYSSLTHRAIAEEGGWCPTLQLETEFRDHVRNT